MGKGWRDVRFGLRMLARNKGFAAIAILALALGIGPNVAIFSIIWATFLAPLPYPHPDRLVVVWTHYKGQRDGTAGDDYAAWRERSHSFEVLAFGTWSVEHLTNPDHSQEPVNGHSVTPGYYSKTLGIPTVLGRDFLPDEGSAGNDHAVLLTHALWATRYHSDAGILGKSILIDDEPYTVAGVLAEGPADRVPNAEFLTPINVKPGVHTTAFGSVLGRLKPGVTLAQAQAEIAAIDRQLVPLRQSGAQDARLWSVSVEPLRNDYINPKLVRNLWLLLAAVGLVLLIACANVANLLLARGSARQQELALRSALGATRAQVVRQLLTESLTLAALGGATGVALGWGIMKGTLAILPYTTAETVVGINAPVLWFSLGASLAAGVIFGCAPAWQAARVNLSETLKQGSRSISGSGRSRTQGALVAVEFALALTLLAGAGMAMHSFWNLTRQDLGVTADHILTGNLQARPRMSIPPPEQIVAGQRRLLASLRAVPGVEEATLTTGLPLLGTGNFPFGIAGQPVDTKNPPRSDLQAASPEFFATFGVRLVRGRFLDDSDTATSPGAVVVNEAFVRRYLSGVDPLTQRLMIGFPQPGKNEPGVPAPFAIVGIFHDIHNDEQLSGGAQPEIISCLWQTRWPFVAFAVRTGTDPGAVLRGVRSVVAREASGYNLVEVQTMDQIIARQTLGDRFGMVLFGGFAAVALLLAALGIYGVMSFAVAQRTHEIGLRMALGAERGEVVGMMVRGGMKLALVGVAIGLAGAFTLGRLMRSTLYGIGSADYGSIGLVAALLLGVAALASWVPARRSADVDPMIALRNE